MTHEAPLADLHLHFAGSVRPDDFLDYLASLDPSSLSWDDYEAAMTSVYGSIPPARQLVASYRSGGHDARTAFTEVFCIGTADAGDFARFNAKYQLLFVAADQSGSPAFVRAEIETLLAGIRREHLRQGISHAELRILLGSDMRTAESSAIIETLLAGLGPDHRLVMSLDRADPWPGWERVKELALESGGSGLVGIDFCAVEEGFPPKRFASLFEDVKTFNDDHPERALAILHHVGESSTDKSLESAVRWVQEAAENGAHRLGHAIALGIDPDHCGEHTRTESVAERIDQIDYDLEHRPALEELGIDIQEDALLIERSTLVGRPVDDVVDISYDSVRLDEVRLRQTYAIERVRATGAIVEVCPTSNFLIGGLDDPAHHPVRRFYDEGLPFVVSSDDPGIFGTTLAAELGWVCELTGGGPELHKELVRRAWASRSELLSGRLVFDD